MIDIQWPKHGTGHKFDHSMVYGQCSHVKLGMRKEIRDGNPDKEARKSISGFSSISWIHIINKTTS